MAKRKRIETLKAQKEQVEGDIKKLEDQLIQIQKHIADLSMAPRADILGKPIDAGDVVGFATEYGRKRVEGVIQGIETVYPEEPTEPPFDVVFVMDEDGNEYELAPEAVALIATYNPTEESNLS